MYETTELGPTIDTSVPGFRLMDHTKAHYTLDELMGRAGLLLGFIGDIWQPVSVRRILWLQRYVQKLSLMGTPAALIVRDHPHTLQSFHLSSPLPVPFPMLADSDGIVHMEFRMDRHPGLLLIDHQHVLRKKWLVPHNRTWPELQEVVYAIQQLGVNA